MSCVCGQRKANQIVYRLWHGDNMTRASDEVKFGIWNSMHEYQFTVHEIAVFTGYPEEEVQEFFDR